MEDAVNRRFTISSPAQNRLRDYLLGRLDSSEEERIEEHLLADDSFFEEFEVVENELVDQYVHGRLSAEEIALFKRRMTQTAEQRQKLAFATVLDEATAAHLEANAKVVPLASYSRKSRLFSRAVLKVAAVVIVAAALFALLWILLGRKTEVDRGMLALNEAYRNERLVESRISGVNYSPLLSTRGGQSKNIDSLAQRHAELLLTEAVRTRGDAASQHALGRFYLAAKNFDQAKQQFEQALKLEPDNAQLHSDLAAAFLEIGKTHRGDDEGKAAENFGKSLEHINRALQLNGSELEALFNRGLVLEQLMLLSRAEEAWQTYLQKDSSSQWADEARRHLESMQKQNQKSQRKRAELHQQFLEAYANRDRQAAWVALAQSRSRMGNQIVETLTDEYLKLATENKAAEVAARLAMLKFAGEVEAETVGDLYTIDLANFYSGTTSAQRQRLGRARNLSAAGLESYNQSEFDKAIKFYTDAFREFRGMNMDPEALFAESWIGYGELRRDGISARKRFERLAEVYREKSYKSLQAQAIHAQSDALTDLNELSKVLALAGEALKISEAIQDDSTRLRCLQQFVSMNLKFGKYVDSLKFGLSAIEIAQHFQHEPKLIWTFYHELALNFQLLGLPATAIEFENRALELAKQSAWPYIIVRSYTQLGLIYERQGDLTNAVSNGLLALEEGKKVGDEKSRLTIVSHATMRLGHIYRETGDFNNALSRYDEALRMFEQLDLGVFRYETHKGKFIALVSAGRLTEADEELKKALALFEQYRTKIQEERNRNSFFDIGQDIYDLAIDFAYNKRHDRVRAFDYSEQSRSRSLLGYLKESPSVVHDGETTDLQHASSARPALFVDLRERLPQEVQLLHYSLGAGKLFVWVVTRDKFESVVVEISEPQFEQKVDGFVKQIAERAVTHETEATAEELYSILIKPVEQFLDTRKQLYIVPDKILVKLPFSALRSSADGKFLLEKFLVAFAPSTNVLIACTNKARSKVEGIKERALVVGNPLFSGKSFPDLPKLPSAEREAREVAAYYDSLPLVGAQARENRVRSQMKNADVIHLASHFVVDPGSPMLSKLLLASENSDVAGNSDSDGVLQVSEIYEMKLTRARLVVLPACQTGLERSYQAEGAISVARSFISVGVPLVVATLWPVESEITSELMISFHRYRKEGGLSTVAALRRAQLDLIGSGDQNRSALNGWASFVAIGGYTDF
jgi:CHAT domain-containing protein/tetratricopeptide (TPR) repeat protein